MTRKILVAALGLFVLITALSADAAGVKVVVHSSNAVDSLSKARIADLFLKRATRWENGRAVIPVDQTEKSDARAAFSKHVLDKEVPWVKSYWQKMIFSGRATPPAELSTDAQVLDFVRANPDSIGYVGEAATVAGSVKVVKVAD
jgi:ABC-type phosphate transport system substrate-binding protein